MQSAKIYGSLESYYGLSIDNKLWVFDEGDQQVRSRKFSEPIQKAIITADADLVLLESGKLRFLGAKSDVPIIVTKVQDIHDIQSIEVGELHVLMLMRDGDLIQTNIPHDVVQPVISDVKTIQGNWIITIRTSEADPLFWVPSSIKLSEDQQALLQVDSENGILNPATSFRARHKKLMGLYLSLTDDVYWHDDGTLIWGQKTFRHVVKCELLGALLTYLTADQQLTIIHPQGTLKIAGVIDFAMIFKGIIYVTREGLFHSFRAHTKRIMQFCQTPARDGCGGSESESEFYIDSLGIPCCRRPKSRKKPKRTLPEGTESWLIDNFPRIPKECIWEYLKFSPVYQIADRVTLPSMNCLDNGTLLSQFMPSIDWIEEQKSYLDSSSEEDRMFVRLYTHQGDRVVNSFIRAGGHITPELQAYFDENATAFNSIPDLSRFLEQMRISLTRLIMNAPPTTETFYVYRGTILDVYQTDQERVYTSQGFFSTSLLIQRARAFSRQQNLVRIKIPIVARV